MPPALVQKWNMNYYHSKHQAYLLRYSKVPSKKKSLTPLICHPSHPTSLFCPVAICSCKSGLVMAVMERIVLGLQEAIKQCGSTDNFHLILSILTTQKFLETLSSQDVTLQEGPVTLLLLGAPHIEDFDFLV